MDTRYCYRKGPGGTLVPVPVSCPQDDAETLDQHKFSRDASRVLDRDMEDQGMKSEYIARRCFSTHSNVSHYRHNKRPLPLAFAALYDNARDEPVFLRLLAEMEGYQIIKIKDPA